MERIFPVSFPPGPIVWGTVVGDGEIAGVVAIGDRISTRSAGDLVRKSPSGAVRNRNQSFLANRHVGDKISHELGWVFDVEAGTPVAVYEGVDLAFSITQRKSVVKPPEVKERELQFLHPDLA